MSELIIIILVIIILVLMFPVIVHFGLYIVKELGPPIVDIWHSYIDAWKESINIIFKR